MSPPTSTPSPSPRSPTGPAGSPNSRRSSPTPNGACDRFELGPHLRLGTTVQRRRPSTRPPAGGAWSWPRPAGEEQIEADTVDLRLRPAQPTPHPRSATASGTFTGPMWHSARWDHRCDLAGQRVAVVGSGASAIQFVPPVAERGRRAHHLPAQPQLRGPEEGPPLQRRRPAGCSTTVTSVERAYRWWIYWSLESRWIWFRKDSWAGRQASRRSSPRAIRRTRSSPTACPRRSVVPDYPVGCKRILISNDWYPALMRPNVERGRPKPIDHVEAGCHGDHRRPAAARRRPHLRHRLLHHRLPGPHPGHRRSRSRPWPTSGRTAPTPTWAPRCPASPTATCSTAPIPTSATTRSCSWWKARSTSSCRPWPSRVEAIRLQEPRRDRRPGRGDPRGLPTGRPPHPEADGLHRVGGRLHQLVQDGVRTGHQQLAHLDRPLLVRHPPPAARRLGIIGAGRSPPPTACRCRRAGRRTVPVRSRCARRGWCPAVRPGSPRRPGPPRPWCSSRRARRRRPAPGWVVRRG